MAETKGQIMTKEGLEQLQAKLDECLAKRNVIANQIEIARGFGDLSENAEYTEAKNDQAKNEEEIVRLTNIISTAQVVDVTNTEKVSVGVTVKLLDVEENEEVEYAIVGTNETDPWNGKISNESPIGEALNNKRVGDKIEIELPGEETITYQILEIRKS